MADEAPMMKAAPFKSLLKFLERELSPAQRDEIYRALPPELADFTRRTILVSDRVPVDLMNTLTEAASRARGEPLESFARRAGGFAADEAVHSVYRWIAYTLTPSYLLSKAGRTWSTLYDRGRFVVEARERGARMELSDFPSHPAFCARASGWFETLGKMTHVRNLRVEHSRCLCRGDAACRWDIAWD